MYVNKYNTITNRAKPAVVVVIFHLQKHFNDSMVKAKDNLHLT